MFVLRAPRARRRCSAVRFGTAIAELRPRGIVEDALASREKGRGAARTDARRIALGDALAVGDAEAIRLRRRRSGEEAQHKGKRQLHRFIPDTGS